jgi:hypothetical protein
MLPPRFRRQFLLFPILALAASALSCGREITGPHGTGRVAAIALDPRFESVRLLGSGEVLGIGSVVPFQKVRVVLRRADGSIAVDSLVDFPPGQDAITLKFTVQLDPAAPSTGEPLSASMKYINAAGDTVFSGGPVTVTAKAAAANNPPPPVEVPIGVYVGPGADAASIVIAPDSFVGVINAQTTFTSTVFSQSQQPLPSAPRAFTSTDSARVRVGLSSGVATLIGARGTALIIAQTLTGQSDTALVRITPTPSALVLVSGGNQQTLQGTPFPNPVRVRVNATDGLGVAGVTVNFAVTRGQGSVSTPSAVTDGNGEAQVNWIAGDSAGAAILTASIPQTAISLAVGGQQISSAPASLTFSASPANFTAGATIPSFTVSVRDGAGGVVAGFSGNVVLSLTGGTAGATLVGTTTRAAVNGVATFPGLTIDRGGSAYRIVASVTGVPSAQTNAFDVAAAPASTITITTGAGQSAPPSTVLPDSIRVRVTDQFGLPKAGLTVQFAVVAGGGSVSPASVTSNVDGRAATAWTIGASGAQQMTVTVGALQPVGVSATVFTGGGTPALFMGVDYISAVVAGSKTVPIYLSPASGSALVAQLTMRDTLVAKWAVDSVVFTAGATLRSPSFTGRGVGSTYGVVTSSAGSDSVLITVDSAGLSLGGSNNIDFVIGDTIRKLIRLSAPAPAGGLTVVARSDDPTAVLVAPGEGLGAPSDPCDIYCYDLRVADGVKLLAPPADSAVVFIPAGQLSGQLVVLPIAQSDGMTVTLTAPGYAGTSAAFAVEEGTLLLYSYYTNLYDPLPVGHRNRIQVQPSQPVSRDIPVRFTSRAPAVARVDTLVTLPRNTNGSSYYDYLGLVAGVSPGQTWVVYQAPGFRTDSFQVNVVAPYVVQLAGSATIATGASTTVSVVTSTDSLGYGFYSPRDTDLWITATSTNSAVVQVPVRSALIRTDDYTTEVGLLGVGVGTAWIRFSAPGHVTDSMPVTVTGPAFQVVDFYARVGRGQVHESLYLQLQGSGNFISGGLTATVTSSDSTIASVQTPLLTFGQYGRTPYARIVGRQPGRVTLTFTVPGMQPVAWPFQVTTPDLFFNTFGGNSTINADSATYSLSVSMRDSISVARGAADTVFAVLRSTNPAVMLVTDSTVVYPTGSSGVSDGQVRAIAPGTAQLILSAPNFTPDTSGLITVKPRALEFSGTTLQHGRRLELPITVFRRSPPSNVLPFAVTIKGPAGLTAKAPADSFPLGASSRVITVRAGALLGTDTVIVSAAGHAPDTVFVVVGNSRAFLSMSNYGLVGQQNDFVSAYMYPAVVGTSRAASDTVKFVIQSADTSIIKVVTDTLRIMPGAFSPTTGGYGSVRYVRPGSTYLRRIDPRGEFAPDSIYLVGQIQQLYPNNDAITLGMQQRSEPYELYFYRDYSTSDSVWVKLTSSAPSIASAPDSVLLNRYSSYAYFTVTAGDTVGGARITGTAPGYAEMTMDVFVTRAAFEGYSSYEQFVVGGRTSADIYLVDVASLYTREAVVDVPFRVRSDDPTIVGIGADSIGTIVAGESYATLGDALRGISLGRTSVVVEDRRGEVVFQSATPARYATEIEATYLDVGNREPSVGLGTYTSSNTNYLYASNGGPPTWVQFRSLGGRVAFAADSVLLDPNTSYYAYYRMTGITTGTDTLVFTAPGYAPDTVVAHVGPSMLQRITSMPATIRQGDSVQVTLYLETPDGVSGAQVAGAAATFTFSSTGAVQAGALAGGAPITSLVVQPGQSTMSFWMKATGAGGGELTITHPNFTTFKMGVGTR